MPSLKEIKTRIKSVKSTQKITKAMKMVATARLRRSKEKLILSREYSLESKNILRAIATECEDIAALPLLARQFLSPQSFAQTLNILVVITSDKGLCGSMNGTILKKTKLKITELQKSGTQTIIYCIGKKGYDSLKSSLKTQVYNPHVTPSSNAEFATSEFMSDICKICEAYPEHGISVSAIYSEFLSTVSQAVAESTAFPLSESSPNSQTSADYATDFPRDSFMEFAIYDYLSSGMQTSILETITSEQSSRMMAMDNATNNASRVIQELTLKYNRTRQANVTREITEIVSGVEAL